MRRVLPRRTPARSDRGAAAVEFALVLPFLMLLLFGIISYGYMLSFRQALSQGAAEGARAAAVAPASSTHAQLTAAAAAAVNDAVSNYGVSCVGTTLKLGATTAGTCTLTVAPCAQSTGKQCATMTLDYRYEDNAPIPSFPGIGLVLPSSLAYAATAQVS